MYLEDDLQYLSKYQLATLGYAIGLGATLFGT
jgi:hypothetical protein